MIANHSRRSTSAADFLWEALPRVPRGLARTGATLNVWLRHTFEPIRLQRALSDILTGEVSWQLLSARSFSGAVPPMAGPFGFHASGGLVFETWAEPALIDLAVRRVFGKATDPVVAGATLAPALRGAFAAIVVEAFRRSSPNAGLVYVTGSERAASDDGKSKLDAVTSTQDEGPFFHLKLWVDQRPFLLLVRANLTELALRCSRPSPDPHALLLAMSSVPLSFALVAAECVLSRRQLGHLTLGDAVVPGAWFLTVQEAAGLSPAHSDDPPNPFEGRAFISAWNAQKGVEVQLGPEGTLTLGSEVLALPWELGERGVEMDLDSAPDPKDEASVNELHRQTLDVPLVVRVEVAQVSLTAREWAELGPGDVVETGVKLGSNVTLRVAGVPVARGELVNIEGELGVRIVELNPR